MNGEVATLQVFTVVALINMLISPLNAFPWVVNGLMEAWVSLDRLEKFIAMPDFDADQYYVDELKNEGAVFARHFKVMFSGGVNSPIGRLNVKNGPHLSFVPVVTFGFQQVGVILHFSKFFPVISGSSMDIQIRIHYHFPTFFWLVGSGLLQLSFFPLAQTSGYATGHIPVYRR